MKNILLFMLATLFIISCSRPPSYEEETPDNALWFAKFKSQEQYLNLYAGQTIPVGTVTVGLVDEGEYAGQLYVKYATTGDWLISETHLFVGEAEDIPRTNKKNPNPKIGRFPYKEDHNPMVSSFTYYLGDFTNFYNAANTDNYPDGFVVAAHAVVNATGQGSETAFAKWGDVEFKDPLVCPRFSDSRWGWYNYYAPDNAEIILSQTLYGVEYVNDSIKIYMISPETGFISLISAQPLPSGESTEVGGFGWDPESNIFFFTTSPENELWIQELGDVSPISISELIGEVVAGDFHEGNYYYVDEFI